MNVPVPFISAIVAAILIILQQSLMLNVGMHRAKTSIGVGVGNDNTLERKARRHGNLAENAGLFIATLTIVELRNAPSIIITVFGAIFVVCRILHAIGFSSLVGSHGPNLSSGNKIFIVMRAIGATGTALTGLALGGFLLFTIGA
ncbi:MAG: MAPEG family protein [Cyanobacteria bacterium J06628_3]